VQVASLILEPISRLDLIGSRRLWGGPFHFHTLDMEATTIHMINLQRLYVVLGRSLI